jgi:septal ring factor EnvC (AmiA/AmiB activator)
MRQEGNNVKKVLGLGLALILMLSLLVSCSGGVSQAQYEKVNSDLTAAQSQIATLQTQLSSKTAELSAKDSQLTAANAKIAKARGEVETLNLIFIPAMTGELNNKTQNEMMSIFLGWRDKVNAIGDTQLTAKFQAIIDSSGGETETMSFFQYLLEDIAKSLE